MRLAITLAWCVHVRLWGIVMLLAGLLGLFTRKSWPMQIAAWSLLLAAAVLAFGVALGGLMCLLRHGL